jgi:hypothetical protein
MHTVAAEQTAHWSECKVWYLIQRDFSRTTAVQTNYPNLGAGIKRQVNVLENLLGLVGQGFGQSDHGKHELPSDRVKSRIFDRLLFLLGHSTASANFPSTTTTALALVLFSV